MEKISTVNLHYSGRELDVPTATLPRPSRGEEDAGVGGREEAYAYPTLVSHRTRCPCSGALNVISKTIKCLLYCLHRLACPETKPAMVSHRKTSTSPLVWVVRHCFTHASPECITLILFQPAPRDLDGGVVW